ncbi:hypothetical protein [Bradyrhizobium sp. CCGUVB1N3]|uniref:hypothetical protein n=1 Tax=Bradyrhizobium sp. CCGUVB1N3 TaxID=2949629 RepID=UPI00353207EE
MPLRSPALESQVRECYGRCAYSHKAHERMADRRAKWLRRWTETILAALTTCGAPGVIFSKDGTYLLLKGATRRRAGRGLHWLRNICVQRNRGIYQD